MNSSMGNGNEPPLPLPQNQPADDSNDLATAGSSTGDTGTSDDAMLPPPAPPANKALAAATTTNTAIPVFRDLGANDVVMGRGAFSIRNEGNIRMGQIVAARRMEYRSTSNRRTKDTIARQVVQQVRSNTGRFLRRIESEGEMQSLGIQSDETAFVLADEDAVLLKAKQSLRDKEGSKGSQPLNDSSAMGDQLSREEGETERTATGDDGHQPKRARMAEASDAGIAVAAIRTDTALATAALSASLATGAASAVSQGTEEPVGQLLASLVMRGAPTGEAAPSRLHPLTLLRQQLQQEQIQQVQLALLQQEQRQREHDQLAALRRQEDLRALGLVNSSSGMGGGGELNLALTLAALESQQQQPSNDARSILVAAQQNPQFLQLLRQRRSADARLSNHSQAAASTTTTSPLALSRQTSTDSNFPYPMSYAATTARRQALERESLEQQQRQQVFELQERLLPSSSPQQRLGEAALSAASLAAALREQSNLPNTNQTLLGRALEQQLQQQLGGGTSFTGPIEDSIRDNFLLRAALERNSVAPTAPSPQQPTAASLLAALQRQDEEQRRLWNNANRYGNSLHAAPAASADRYGDAAALLRASQSQLALGSSTPAPSSLMPGTATMNPHATSARTATRAGTTSEPSVARAEEESKADSAVPTPAARKRDCK